MTRENLETMFAAIDARDWNGAARHFHPEMQYERPGYELIDGREANLAFYRDIRKIQGVHLFDGFAITPDTGACWGRFVGHRSDGTPLDLQFADCYRFRDGLLWRRKSFFFVPLA